MAELNYHHLRLFRAVAREGNLTRAAHHLNLSQSALSTQIKTLEDRLGHALFDRIGRALVMTEAGRIALDHAETIFETGDELLRVLNDAGRIQSVVRIGAVSTLSRNFQLAFIEPALRRNDVEVILRSGPAEQLLPALEALQLDVVLSTQPPARDAMTAYVAHKLSEDRVSLVGSPRRANGITSVEQAIKTQPFVLPGRASTLRAGWDAMTETLGMTPKLAAEVDDMAMMRLMARADVGLALVPPIVVASELDRGLLRELPITLPLAETFYAVTTKRRFPNPIAVEMITGFGTS